MEKDNKELNIKIINMCDMKIKSIGHELYKLEKVRLGLKQIYK